MSSFQYMNDRLHAEGVELSDIARRFGTPCYVYSRADITDTAMAYEKALAGRPHLLCYAMKANSNLAILDLMARLGLGFDVVSIGELKRVLAAGGDAGKVVFSGVGKTEAEMIFALEAGVRCFNIESEPELYRLNQVATRLGKRAPISLRVNPDVDPKTHPYIATGLRSSKFGVAYDEALYLYRAAKGMPGIAIEGIDCHIGSQITELSPFVDAAARVIAMVDQLAAEGIHLKHVDFGGGLGIRYESETPPKVGEYIAALNEAIGNRPLELVLEPGRSIIGNAGILLTRVEYRKKGSGSDFVIVDAAMNDLKRPTLYDAYHAILPVAPRSGERTLSEVVGPICESGDFLGKGRLLAVKEGDLLAVMSCGAYGMSMSSNYNSRPRVAEVMVDSDCCHLIRRRESFEELWANESPLPPD